MHFACQLLNIILQHTGIFDVFKNSNSASNEPNVDAWTYTPSELNFIWLSADRSSFATSSLKKAKKIDEKIFGCRLICENRLNY